LLKFLSEGERLVGVEGEINFVVFVRVIGVVDLMGVEEVMGRVGLEVGGVVEGGGGIVVEEVIDFVVSVRVTGVVDKFGRVMGVFVGDEISKISGTSVGAE
jgi:hypothetical protein